MLLFFAVLSGIFGIGIMQLILAAALPYIVQDLGGDYLYSWVFSSYMLASILSIPIFSKLADRFGKKRFYLIGTLFFGIGSLTGALAPSMEVLVAGRTVQGLGAGVIAPLSLALITDIFPEEKRGAMIGVFGFVQLISNLISPPLGSFLTRNLGWNWVFILNMIFIGLAGIIVLFSGKTGTVSTTKHSKIDIKGSLLFGLFCVLTVGISKLVSGGTDNPWLIPVFLFTAGVILFFLIKTEKKQGDPVLKAYFFTDPQIRRSIISSILSGVVMYSLVTVLPLVEMVASRNLGRKDSFFLFFMSGITTGLLLFGRAAGLKKLSFLPRLLWGGGAVSAVCLIFTGSSPPLFSIAVAFEGLCLGGVMAAFMLRSQNSTEAENRTAISGIIQLSRYFGAAVGVSLITGLMPPVSGLESFSDFSRGFVSLAVVSLGGVLNEYL